MINVPLSSAWWSDIPVLSFAIRMFLFYFNAHLLASGFSEESSWIGSERLSQCTGWDCRVGVVIDVHMFLVWITTITFSIVPIILVDWPLWPLLYSVGRVTRDGVPLTKSKIFHHAKTRLDVTFQKYLFIPSKTFWSWSLTSWQDAIYAVFWLSLDTDRRFSGFLNKHCIALHSWLFLCSLIVCETSNTCFTVVDFILRVTPGRIVVATSDTTHTLSLSWLLNY